MKIRRVRIDDPHHAPLHFLAMDDDRLREGKVPWELVSGHLGDALPEGVLLGPACGEDAALVEIGGDVWAVASDPISFTSSDAGRLAVEINANDVAVRGARPRFFLAVVLLAPSEASSERVSEILDQVQAACRGLDVTLIGGHTEVAPGLGHSVVVGTMLGPVLGRPVTTGGLRPGDRIGMTGWAGMEGSAILMRDHGDRLRELGDPALVEACADIADSGSLLVVDEALAAAAVAGVSSLHDVTEGGVGEALHELSRASGLELDVRPEDVPVLPATRTVCAVLGIDPLGLIGSGALLIGCSEAALGEVERAVQSRGRPVHWIGRALAPGDGCSVPRFPRDEILKAWYLEGIRAVVFDMDGTVVDSDYDWPAIRDRLAIDGPSIIDQLNRLPTPERDEKWAILHAIEEEATRSATLKGGALELLELLKESGICTALVTNNTDHNARHLIERLGLRFDVVLTRDSGLWKPSGAPISEAIRLLDVAPEECLAVGDSSYDLDSAREAGCGRVCLLYGGAERHGARADLAFPDVTALTRYLRVVL
jgi:HAD superfamily hydrolase (TIGR01509 family)